MEISEKVGTREFTAELLLDAVVVIREQGKEFNRLTLNDALAQENNDAGILQSTIGEALHALVRQYARTI